MRKGIWRWGFGDGYSAVFWGWVESVVPSFDFTPIFVKEVFAPGVVIDKSGGRGVVEKRVPGFCHACFSPAISQKAQTPKATLACGGSKAVKGGLTSKISEKEKAALLAPGGRGVKTIESHDEKKSVKPTLKPKVAK